MKQYILIDKGNICRCIASDECNLHADKIAAGMKTVLLDASCRIGDEVVDGKVTPHPENYPGPSEAEVIEQKIQAEMRLIAIERLKEKGEIT